MRRLMAWAALAGLAGCEDKAEDTGESLGSVEVAAADGGELGGLESWEVASALWIEQGGTIELWGISLEDGELVYVAEAMLDPLHLSTSASTCAAAREDFASQLALSEALVDGLADTTPLADICDRITTFVEGLRELDEADAERWTLNGHTEDLGSEPASGDFALTGSLVQRTSSSQPWDAWDPDSCTFSDDPSLWGEALYWEVEGDVTLDVEPATVAGSLSAVVAGDDGSSATLESKFTADRCVYPGGALVGF